MKLRDMKFKVLSVKIHDFVPVKQVGNVVLAKCVCCQIPRFAVYKISEKNRFFYYHGNDFEYAQRTFNFLVQKQVQLQQVQ